jgi:hypothetical protein
MKTTLLLIISAVFAVSTAAAQDRAVDEKAIRAAIAALDAGTDGPRMLPDGVQWTGAYKYPLFSSKDKAVEIDHPRVQNRLREANGRFALKSKTTVRKLEIAQAADMAYEVSDVELTVQLKGSKGTETDTFMTSTLRVWKKVDGTWRPAAAFNFAHDGSYPNPAGPRAR